MCFAQINVEALHNWTALASLWALSVVILTSVVRVDARRPRCGDHSVLDTQSAINVPNNAECVRLDIRVHGADFIVNVVFINALMNLHVQKNS
jgi:nucleoside phosphorylase